MNTFEQMSSRVALSVAEANGLMRATPAGAAASSARNPEGTQARKRARVVAVHDAVPAALAGGLDVLGAIIDENRLRRCQRKAPFGFGIDARRRGFMTPAR